MKQRIFNLLYIGATALAVANLASCDKTGGFQDPSFSRMFMPNSALKATTDATTATLSWGGSLYNDTAANKIYYVLQLASDAAFTSIVRTDTTTALNKKYTDADLAVKKDYYPQVKVLGVNGAGDSQWLKGNKFSILGENLFITPSGGDIQYYTAILRWRHQDGLTKVTITNNGASVDSLISADTLFLRNLTPKTTYTAELFKGATSKGTMTFTTKDAGMFTKIIDPSASLSTEITNASSGAVLGLMDGTYDLGAGSSGFAVTGKNITIASVSGASTNVTILNADFILKGAGAGIKLSGLTLSGPAKGYVVDIAADATGVGDITLENCNIVFPSGGFAIVRANRGATTMGTLTITDCVGIGLGLNDNYGIAMMDKIKFAAVVIKNSTFSGFKRNIVSAPTTLAGWAAPITIDKCTFNYFGGGSKAAVADCGANNLTLTIKNTILANTPLNLETVLAAAIVSSTNTPSLSKVFYFNCNTGGATSGPLTWPTGAAATTDISWTSTTTDFTLPAASSLRTAGTDGGCVGDPRWAK
ncbi:DUF5123 domain-containing protein [Pinibacter aurantiacus]|uniref:DUF5123 domain-containing protein n=1 Tax=Pinibacter aurantiacus TaxID=2851599 RepID=A0A9E2S877_9BACT|nr:DUF5123 domain-containing protein [Pinibacter aurantiacus]MBV4357671.1 hypothetical protein [Pinibacter aurantiacus]